MSDPSNASGHAPPRPLLSLAAELDAQATPATVRTRSAPRPIRPAPERAKPGALALALAEARARAAEMSAAPPSGVGAQPSPSSPTGKPSRAGMAGLLAGGAILCGAPALFLMPLASAQRDLALGALLCLVLALAGVAAGPVRGSLRHAPEPVAESPAAPAPPEAVPAPTPPLPDELRASLLAIRRAMTEPPERAAQAST
ncbi:MAG TPA: hypothetical protein VGN97_11595 [Mesorhizobium sp.]|jgi:hypothetical protein|nr:hypothetical protein [Mesorhizobium sp.]